MYNYNDSAGIVSIMFNASTPPPPPQKKKKKKKKKEIFFLIGFTKKMITKKM